MFVCLTSTETMAPMMDEMRPTALIHTDLLIRSEAIQAVNAPTVDHRIAALEDEEHELRGFAPRFAIPNPVYMTPDTDGVWEEVGKDTLVWRLRISSPGALSLNLGFTCYTMPEGGQLFIYASDFSQVLRPFTAQDNAEHGELWTPVLLSDDIMVEVTIPTSVKDELELELTSINVGYRGFGEIKDDKSGSCNIDVICSEGDDWGDEIPAVGVISTGGSLFCTGAMVNNTSEDQTPYFLTANHCSISSGNAASLVVYWNYESPTCGQQGGGSLSQWQSGSYWRAGYSSSDFTLVELDEDPDLSWNVTFAGWDRGNADPTSATAIHHPDTDEKSISFEYDPTQTASYLSSSSPGDGTHIRVIDWDQGTTEPGSSGSPLFDQNHRIVGQLHGGYAACGNDESDWYGRFSVSWDGGGSPSTRLSDWLDSGNTGAASVDTLVPGATGMSVTPLDGISASGPAGGPFTPDSTVYTLENLGETGFSYNVYAGQSWVSISNDSGYLGGYAATDVTLSINIDADTLPNGNYTDTVSFINTTDHEGDTTRPVTLGIGVPTVQYAWNMDVDPGWSTQGLWAWGQPTGSGGDYGGPDPTVGFTGDNVYGYNLSGDYENNLPETHLTSTAIDCTGLSEVTLKLRRWLGVEQPLYDHAYVRVSGNGTDWSIIWENTAEVADTSWTLQEFDISSIADGEATVYLRWTIGPTDGSWQYCGWNIDDIEIILHRCRDRHFHHD
ncbi:trypsin-like peptidase domain-containing protein, partial [Thermodesulfobacteriota bacterium]